MQNTSLLGRKLLVSVTLIFAFAPSGISAMPSPTLDNHRVKVKLGEVTRVNDIFDTFTLKLASSTLSVIFTSSTTIYMGTGEEVTSAVIEKGEKVYVFGVPDDDGSFIAEKIVIKNPSKLSRSNLQQYRNDKLTEVSSVISVWTTLWKGVTFTTVYGAERIQEGIGYLESSSTKPYGNGQVLPKEALTEGTKSLMNQTTRETSTSSPKSDKNSEPDLRQRLII